jgi:hypothetical protein
VSHKVEATDFPAWVFKQGGLEEIKRLMVKKPEAIAKQEAVKAATVSVKDELEDNAIKPLAHVSLNGLSGTYAVLLVKPCVNGGADIVGTLSDINEAMVNALIQRMAKAQVADAAEHKGLAQQTQRESSDLLAVANDEQICKVANG